MDTKTAQQLELEILKLASKAIGIIESALQILKTIPEHNEKEEYQRKTIYRFEDATHSLKNGLEGLVYVPFKNY